MPSYTRLTETLPRGGLLERPYAADGVNAAADTWRCLATEERTVFDHIGVGVSDPKASKAFFLQGFPH